MANNASDYLEQAILRKNLRGTDYTTPTSTRVSLHTADPGEGTGAAEVSTALWTNYARALVNTDRATSPFWGDAASDGAGGFRCASSGVISFGSAAITGSAPTVTHFGVWDHLGNLLYSGALSAGVVINNGAPVSFANSALTIGQK